MRWADIPFNPPPRTLRWFSLFGVLFLAGLACVQVWRSDNRLAAAVLGGVAALLGLAGLLAPRLVRPVYVGLMVLTFPIGWVMSHVLLGLVFYGVITPLALFFKLVGRDALARRFEPARESYWAPKRGAADMRSYFRQS
jgi:hypothetical protein